MDTGQPSLDVLNLFRSGLAASKPLLQALSQDPVPLITVELLQSLGSKIDVADQLYEKGLTALGGDRNIKLADLKLAIGIRKGWVSSTFRQSTQLVRVFLLIAALRYAAYQEKDLAQFLYQLLLSTRLIDRDDKPTTQHSLRKLIKVLSGNCENLQKSIAETHDEVGLAISNLDASFRAPRLLHLDMKEMADLFLECFEALQDTTVVCIELRGCRGLLWVATVLRWLHPEQVGLFTPEEKPLVGSSESRVKIILTCPSGPSASLRWRVRPWSGQSTLRDIITGRDNNPSAEYLQPSPHSYPRHKVWEYLKINGLADDEIATIGGVAAGLIDIVFEEGRIFSPDYVNWPATPIKRLIANFVDVCPRDSAFRAGSVLEEYGWDLETIQAVRGEFLTWERYQRHPNDSPKPAAMKPYVQRSASTTRRPVHGTKSYASSAIEEFLKHTLYSDKVNPQPPTANNRDCSQTLSVAIDHILRIAQHGILSAFIEFDASVVDFYRSGVDNDLVWCLLDPDGSATNPGKRKITAAELRRRCFLSLGVLSTTVNNGEIPFMASGQGVTVFPRVIETHSTDRHMLLQLAVFPGTINHKNRSYELLTEDHTQAPFLGPWTERTVAPRLDINFDRDPDSLIRQPPPNPTRARLHYTFSTDEDDLLKMKSKLYTAHGLGQESELIRHVTYDSTTTSLMLATHVQGYHQNASTHAVEELRRIAEQGISLVDCTPVKNAPPNVGFKFVTYMPRTPEQRFFAAHPSFYTSLHALYIQHGGDLANTLFKIVGNSAGSENRNAESCGEVFWKVIIGNDT